MEGCACNYLPCLVSPEMSTNYMMISSCCVIARKVLMLFEKTRCKFWDILNFFLSAPLTCLDSEVLKTSFEIHFANVQCRFNNDAGLSVRSPTFDCRTPLAKN